MALACRWIGQQEILAVKAFSPFSTSERGHGVGWSAANPKRIAPQIIEVIAFMGQRSSRGGVFCWVEGLSRVARWLLACRSSRQASRLLMLKT